MRQISYQIQNTQIENEIVSVLTTIIITLTTLF
nr:MAG TPA: hypothetical protein [Caudoviricetes sp.]